MDAIKGVMTKVIEELQRKSSHNPVVQAWQEFSDKETRVHVRPLGLQNKALRVAVDSSAWMYEMNLRKEQLLGALKARGVEVNKVIFFIGKI